MENLHVFLFGCMRIEQGNPITEIRLPPKISALLSYLLLTRQRTHSRDVLAGLFWGEQSQRRARDCLNTALWRLRSALEPAGVSPGAYLLGANSEEVGFNQNSDFWLDVAEFEGSTTPALAAPLEAARPEQIERLEGSLAIYTGDLLEGCYDDWALYERERFRGIYVDCLFYLLRYHSFHHEYERSIQLAHKILQLDPLREEIHRKLMEIYAANGQRLAALQQYQACAALLKDELDVAPLPETQALYHALRAEESPPETSNLTELAEGLHTLKKTLNTLEEQVMQLIQAVEGISTKR